METQSAARSSELLRLRKAIRRTPSRGTPGWPAVALGLALVATGILPGACGKAADPDAPFQMSLNGNRYLPGVGSPQAALTEVEAGFSNSYRCTVIFPLKALKNRSQPGLEIIFDPAAIPVGEEVSVGADGDGPRIQIAYYPFFGGMSNDGKMLIYAIGEEGSARLRIDDLDTQARHIQGLLIEAVLFGRYMGEDGEVLEPTNPKELHLSNFPFDVELSDELW